MSVFLLVTAVSHTKIAEPVEVPFRIWTQEVPVNHVLDGCPGPSMGGGYFGNIRPVFDILNLIR